MNTDIMPKASEALKEAAKWFRIHVISKIHQSVRSGNFSAFIDLKAFSNLPDEVLAEFIIELESKGYTCSVSGRSFNIHFTK
jgi:hypothetical protein